MRDVSKPLRLAVFAAIDGNTGGIPVYDEKRLVSSTAQTFILLSTQQQTPFEDNDCTWITKNSIDIEIVQKTGSEVSKDGVDDIANTVLTLLLTAVWTTPLTSINLQFANPYIESVISRNISFSETESVLQKVIRFVVTIIQQN